MTQTATTKAQYSQEEFSIYSRMMQNLPLAKADSGTLAAAHAEATYSLIKNDLWQRVRNAYEAANSFQVEPSIPGRPISTMKISHTPTSNFVFSGLNKDGTIFVTANPREIPKDGTLLFTRKYENGKWDIRENISPNVNTAYFGRLSMLNEIEKNNVAYARLALTELPKIPVSKPISFSGLPAEKNGGVEKLVGRGAEFTALPAVFLNYLTGQAIPLPIYVVEKDDGVVLLDLLTESKWEAPTVEKAVKRLAQSELLPYGAVYCKSATGKLIALDAVPAEWKQRADSIAGAAGYISMATMIMPDASATKAVGLAAGIPAMGWFSWRAIEHFYTQATRQKKYFNPTNPEDWRSAGILLAGIMMKGKSAVMLRTAGISMMVGADIMPAVQMYAKVQNAESVRGREAAKKEMFEFWKTHGGALAASVAMNVFFLKREAGGLVQEGSLQESRIKLPKILRSGIGGYIPGETVSEKGMEIFPTGKPIDLYLAGERLQILDVRGTRWSTPFLVIDPKIFDPANPTTGYKGLRPGKPILLGRETADGRRFQFPKSVSRRHAEITYDGEKIIIKDLNSANGTKVYGGSKIDPNYMRSLKERRDSGERSEGVITADGTKSPSGVFAEYSEGLMAAVTSKRKGPSEDHALVATLPNGTVVLGVFDGMGGHGGGDIASRITAESVKAAVSEKRPASEGLVTASRNMSEYLEKNPYTAKDMGTTACVAEISPDGVAAITNVGDSKAYLLRDGKVTQLTKDQSSFYGYLEAAVKFEGMPKEYLDPRLYDNLSTLKKIADGGNKDAEKALFIYKSQRHVIRRAVGAQYENSVADTAELQLRKGDILFIVSDGIGDVVTTTALENIFSRNSPKDAIKQIVDLANGRTNSEYGTVKWPDGRTEGYIGKQDDKGIALYRYK